MTKFTNDTAFKLIFQRYIKPPISTIIIVTVININTAVCTLSPDTIYVTTPTAAKEYPIDANASPHIVKYCS